MDKFTRNLFFIRVKFARSAVLSSISVALLTCGYGP